MFDTVIFRLILLIASFDQIFALSSQPAKSENKSRLSLASLTNTSLTLPKNIYLFLFFTLALFFSYVALCFMPYVSIINIHISIIQCSYSIRQTTFQFLLNAKAPVVYHLRLLHRNWSWISELTSSRDALSKICSASYKIYCCEFSQESFSRKNSKHFCLIYSKSNKSQGIFSYRQATLLDKQHGCLIFRTKCKNSSVLFLALKQPTSLYLENRNDYLPISSFLFLIPFST